MEACSQVHLALRTADATTAVSNMGIRGLRSFSNYFRVHAENRLIWLLNLFVHILAYKLSYSVALNRGGILACANLT